MKDRKGSRPFSGMDSSMNKSETKLKSKAAVLGIRTVASVMAAMTVCASFYYNTSVASTFRATMAERNLSIYNTNGFEFESLSSDSGVLATVVPEVELYPEAFQELQQQQRQRQQRRQQEEPKKQSQPDPSSWTGPQRSAMRHEFRKHNRDSIYSLLLLPEENTTSIATAATATATTSIKPRRKTSASFDTVLQWDELFQFIHEHFRKRHKQGLYETHDPFGLEFEGAKNDGHDKYQKNPFMLAAAWGNANANANAEHTGNTKNGNEHEHSHGVNDETQTQQIQAPRLIFEHDLCHAFKHAKAIANFSTPHVLIAHLNENWGTLSSEVENRTANWGDVTRGHFGKSDCEASQVKELYLDSPYTLAVFTTQHQSLFDHPKVHSLPIGVAKSVDSGERLLRSLQTQRKERSLPILQKSGDPDPRPQLLMINNSPTDVRRPQIDAVVTNFRNSPMGVVVRNTFSTSFSEESMTRYFGEMSRSKFVLCPSGLGWDSYRIWEALTLGVIPVIEKHNYRYEVLVFPPGSGKRTRLLRTLGKGETVDPTRKDTKIEGVNVALYLQRNNATLEVVEYEDGWRKSLEDLPVVWIDGEFGATPDASHTTPNNNNNNNNSHRHQHQHRQRNFLTPEFLEQEYDRLAARAQTFKYEKLTSLYWIRFIESFLLLEHPEDAHYYYNDNNNDNVNDNVNDNDNDKGLQKHLQHQSSIEEQRKWKIAMETLSTVYNDHDYYADGIPWKTHDEMVGMDQAQLSQIVNTAAAADDNDSQQAGVSPREHNGNNDANDNDNANAPSPYLFGDQQPKVLSWIILMQFKLLGVALVYFCAKKHFTGEIVATAKETRSIPNGQLSVS